MHSDDELACVLVLELALVAEIHAAGELLELAKQASATRDTAAQKLSDLQQKYYPEINYERFNDYRTNQPRGSGGTKERL